MGLCQLELSIKTFICSLGNTDFLVANVEVKLIQSAIDCTSFLNKTVFPKTVQVSNCVILKPLFEIINCHEEFSRLKGVKLYVGLELV